MIFDLFHSISDPIVNGTSLGPKKVFSNFFEQAILAEKLGVDTIWCAESHFSSETQKKTSVATIPSFFGEVGINCDSFQLAQLLINRTERVNFGTAIHNIVGGSGGPLASAERVKFLSFLNSTVAGWNRKLRIGVAAGRFPYQNTPFQIVPRNQTERELWHYLKRYIFLEALEVFLRLLSGEEVDAFKVRKWTFDPAEITEPDLRAKYKALIEIEKYWSFEAVRLVPYETQSNNLEIVLGSHDPLAIDWGLKFWDLSLFNLSFTAPEKIEALHTSMKERSNRYRRVWTRARLPRTVMVFIQNKRDKAYQLAENVLDNYIEAMRGTAQVPDKKVLMQRALVGDPSEIRDQIKEGGSRGVHPEDRLMLWFEFNQFDNNEIQNQMKLFFDEVVAKL